MEKNNVSRETIVRLRHGILGQKWSTRRYQNMYKGINWRRGDTKVDDLLDPLYWNCKDKDDIKEDIYGES